MFAALNSFQVGGKPTFVSDVFSISLYTGNGSTQTITNGIDLSTKGGLVWLKSRSVVGNNWTQDTILGINSVLYPNLTNAAGNPAGTAVTTFNTTGFSLGTNTNINNSGDTYTSWTFRKQAKFFDIVTWTGDGIANRLISHSLTSTPGFIVVKRTDTTSDWKAHDASTGFQLCLNLTDAANSTASLAGGYPGSGTSTTFRLFAQSGSLDAVNASGGTYVAYLFAHNAGGFGASGNDNIISCGSYTGNGTSQTISLGYEPQWILTKSTISINGDWEILDTMRGFPVTGSSTAKRLEPNLSAAESDISATANDIGPVATGFNVSGAGSRFNGNSVSYIYIAIKAS
jgi:hypothetical protein